MPRCRMERAYPLAVSLVPHVFQERFVMSIARQEELTGGMAAVASAQAYGKGLIRFSRELQGSDSLLGRREVRWCQTAGLGRSS